ncbi:MAG: protein phosphatase CheZ [Proteobacteria bacterium]|nr:protein phosphatase CheZ [Pseudomonadota bacterium]
MQRKAFRIESMLTGRRADLDAAASPAPRPNGARPSHADASDLRAELEFVRSAIARHRQDINTLRGDANDRRFSRAAAELGAAVDDMRNATNQILNLAETADDSARALAASLKDDYKRGLAQEIQDQIVKIYETCNFQDITGQHITKVIGLLSAMEGQLDTILARFNGTQDAALPPPHANSDALLNGPKLAGDTGHATQQDVDRIFG